MAQAQTNHTHSTVNFLLRRMRHNKDFPTFSKYMIEINQKLSSKEKYLSASDVANVILKDYSLTNKLLKMVNSAFYGISTGKVTTITKAVILLGFEKVRLAAASLILFKHLQSKNQTSELKDATINSLVSGLFARNLAERLEIETEEAFICSMLHNLGSHLVIFYLPEEYKEIKRRTAQTGEDETTASRSVLGVSYDDLGMAVAKTWKFPETIISSMERLPQGRIDKDLKDNLLRSISNFSNEICDIISKTEENSLEKVLSATTNRFKKIIPLSQKQLFKLLGSLKEDVEKYSGVINIDIRNSSLVRRLTPDSEPQGQGSNIYNTEHVSSHKSQETAMNNEPLHEEYGVPYTADDDEDTQHILASGIQEITNVLVENYNLNDVMIMILETMYRGFGFNRVIFCMMAATRKTMHARFGLGKDIDDLIKSFGFKLTKSSDFFNQAVSQGKDFCIDNSNASDIKAQIPGWYRKIINAPAFIIYPIFVNNICMGLFYADKEDKGMPVPENLLNYLNTLRSQMILAIKKGR